MTGPLTALASSHDGFDLLVRNLVMKPGLIFRRGDPRTLEERLDFITASVAAANREALSKAPRGALAMAVSTAIAELPPSPLVEDDEKSAPQAVHGCFTRWFLKGTRS